MSFILNGVTYTTTSTHAISEAFADTALSSNINYVYIITPYDELNVPGLQSYVYVSTLPTLTTLNATALTSTSLTLSLSGAYTTVDICRCQCSCI